MEEGGGGLKTGGGGQVYPVSRMCVCICVCVCGGAGVSDPRFSHFVAPPPLPQVMPCPQGLQPDAQGVRMASEGARVSNEAYC